MILVDAGLLIDFLRTKDAKLANLFRILPIAVCGVTRLKFLRALAVTKTANGSLRFWAHSSRRPFASRPGTLLVRNSHRFLQAALRFHSQTPWSRRLPSKGRWKFGRAIRISR